MTKEKRISARLSAQTAERLQRIIKATNSNMSQAIAKAIDIYFAETIKRKAGSWMTLEKVGFIGCAKGPKDLSENHKRYLTQELAKKL